MAELLELEGKVVGVILTKWARKGGVEFPTPEDLPMQFAIHVRGLGKDVPPHAHYKVDAKKHDYFEFFYVEKGRMILELFDNDSKPWKSIEMSTGDIGMISCAHAIKFLEETSLVEVKPGPYEGRDKDKYDL